MIKLISTIGIFIVYSFPLFSQIYDATPCNIGTRNKDTADGLQNLIKNDLKNFYLWEQYGSNYPNYYSKWTSSILKPDGLPPKKQVSFNVDGLGKETIYTQKYVSYSCKYSPASLFDNKIETAWSEGVEGDGLGEYTFARIDITKPIKIWNGFGKSNDLFYKNNRIKDATIYIFLSKCQSDGQDAKSYSSFIFIEKFNFVLKDLNNFQEIKIPNSILDVYNKILQDPQNPKECYNGINFNSFIAIQIDSVYKGSHFSDTLITEIQN